MDWCERCYNTGEVDCYCGGDLCVCWHNGTYACPNCDGGRNIACDEIEDDETP